MKSLLPIQSPEPLNEDELRFLRRKEQQERRQFYRGLRLIIFLCFGCPFLVAWVRALGGARNPFSMLVYFASVLFLMAFSGVVCYIAYRTFLHKVQLDIRRNTKLVERTHITRKLYMPHNNTWHFYLDSPTQLSIEVSEADYHVWRTGDELNIEYTSHSQTYLGYY